MVCEQDIKRVKEELKRNGVGDKIYHSKILQESQTVLALHAFLVPLRSSLEAYQGLPSDLRLAKQEVCGVCVVVLRRLYMAYA